MHVGMKSTASILGNEIRYFLCLQTTKMIAWYGWFMLITWVGSWLYRHSGSLGTLLLSSSSTTRFPPPLLRSRSLQPRLSRWWPTAPILTRRLSCTNRRWWLGSGRSSLSCRTCSVFWSHRSRKNHLYSGMVKSCYTSYSNSHLHS